MVLGWRRAFCTTIPRDREKQDNSNPSPSSKLGSKFKLFSSSSSSSNPPTPRLQSYDFQQQVSSPKSVTLRCRTTAAPPPLSTTVTLPPLRCKTPKSSPRLFNFSCPSSPRSPSTFSFLKSSLRNSKSRCCICLQTMKTKQGKAIFTAECSHSFHFPCVAAHVQKEGTLTCPVCYSTWKQMPVLSIHNVDTSNNLSETKSSESPRPIHVDINSKIHNNPMLKVYNDDEPLMSPTSGCRFNPIPEYDEENENAEFLGLSNSTTNNPGRANANKIVDVSLSQEAAVIAVGRSSETYAIVLKLKGPAISGKTGRAPIDVVTVLDVSGKMNGTKLMMMKKAMRIVLSSLSPNDRLSIVAFSTTSKRMMTCSGRRFARRIVEATIGIEGTSSNSTDAVKKAVKVLEDRRDKNPATSILLHQ
ncbi:ion channel [Lithospermum erythrorhizon]|uniref:Ion channel n=1 Tax=Lithospermum erythrorhizon TaxID=34254 RepID=A0AAV3RGP5_LITER